MVDVADEKLGSTEIRLGILSIPLFVARKKFREGKTTDGVKVYALGDGFKTDFFGLVERNLNPTMLRIQHLKKSDRGEVVHSKLGGKEVFLAHFWGLLKLDPKPFVVAPCHGQFVFAHWRIDREGWFVDSCPITTRRFRLEEGDQIGTQ